jgi:hypothetical protein
MALTIRQTGIAIALATVVVAAFALGWWQGDDRDRGAATNTADSEWRPVTPVIPDLAGDAKILAERQPFGAPLATAGVPPAPAAAGPPGAAATPPPVQWRVDGVVTTETGPYLILMIGKPGEKSARSEIRHQGEDLPDGSVVRSIEPTSVTIDRRGTIVRIKMFAQN